MGLHTGWNFFEGTVFGFPVSGLGDFPRIIDQAVNGPARITGGLFGPEAGLVLLPALLLGARTGLPVHPSAPQAWNFSDRGKYPIIRYVSLFSTLNSRLSTIVRIISSYSFPPCPSSSPSLPLP